MAVFKKINTQGLFARYRAQIRQLDQELILLVETLLTNLGLMFRNGLNFSDNFDGMEVSVTAHATPDTEFSVAHTLRRIPTRFLVTDIDEGGVVYKSGTAWTDTTAYLKCTTGGSAIKVFLY